MAAPAGLECNEGSSHERIRSTCARVLAQEASASAGANMPLGAAAAQLYALFNAAGSAGDDLFGIIKILCDWA